MSNTNITKNVSITAVPKQYKADDGTCYSYYVYYADINGVSVRLSTSEKDYTGKQLLKSFFSK